MKCRRRGEEAYRHYSAPDREIHAWRKNVVDPRHFSSESDPPGKSVEEWERLSEDELEKERDAMWRACEKRVVARDSMAQLVGGGGAGASGGGAGASTNASGGGAGASTNDSMAQRVGGGGAGASSGGAGASTNDGVSVPHPTQTLLGLPWDLVDRIAAAFAMADGGSLCSLACTCTDVATRLSAMAKEAVRIQEEVLLAKPWRKRAMARYPGTGLIGCRLSYVVDAGTRVEGLITHYNAIDAEATVEAPGQPRRDIVLNPRSARSWNNVCACGLAQRPTEIAAGRDCTPCRTDAAFFPHMFRHYIITGTYDCQAKAANPLLWVPGGIRSECHKQAMRTAGTKRGHCNSDLRVTVPGWASP